MTDASLTAAQHRPTIAAVVATMGHAADLVSLFKSTGADIACGRPTDTSGKTINGKFGLGPCGLGYREYYDPALVAHHPEVLVTQARGDGYWRVPAYARGMGFFLAKHRYPLRTVLVWSARPVVGALLNAVRSNFWQAGLRFQSVQRRLQGYITRRCPIPVKAAKHGGNLL